MPVYTVLFSKATSQPSLNIAVTECGDGRVETEFGGTRRRTGGEVKGKEANGVGSQAVFSFTRNSPSSVRARSEPDGTR